MCAIFLVMCAPRVTVAVRVVEDYDRRTSTLGVTRVAPVAKENKCNPPDTR